MPPFQIKFMPDDRIIEANAGMSLLNAAAKAEIYIKSGCGGKGTCGACKVVVLSGDPLVAGTGTLTPEQISAANKALTEFDYRSELYKITAETLVISGKYDGLNPPTEGKICAKLIKKAVFVEMQYSGHLPMLEEEERYNDIIDKFLQSGY